MLVLGRDKFYTIKFGTHFDAVVSTLAIYLVEVIFAE